MPIEALSALLLLGLALLFVFAGVNRVDPSRNTITDRLLIAFQAEQGIVSSVSQDRQQLAVSATEIDDACALGHEAKNHFVVETLCEKDARRLVRPGLARSSGSSSSIWRKRSGTSGG